MFLTSGMCLQMRSANWNHFYMQHDDGDDDDDDDDDV